MGIVAVDTKYGPLQFNIKGDQPSASEQLKIEDVLVAPEEYFSKEKIADYDKKQKGFDVGFDTKTGIKDAGLRAGLSLAENTAEEEARLAQQGLSPEDYTRDSRGRLALTPSGAAKFGVETDKNVLIDERGLTRYDFADLAGIAPEVGGAIAGTLKGAAAGTAIAPGVGTFIGGVLGAATGGGGGNLLEEAIEGVSGVSRQSAGERAKDTAVEAAIAGVGEGIFSGIAKLMGYGFKGARPTATDDVVEVAGMGREEFGITPAAGLIGANPILARSIATGEKVFGGSSRTYKNGEAIKAELQRMREAAGIQGTEADITGLGQMTLAALNTGDKALKKQIREIEQKIVQQFRNISDDFRKAATDDSITAIDDDLYRSFKEAYEDFENTASAEFSAIDAATKSAIGRDQIIDTRGVLNTAKQALKNYRGIGAGGTTSQQKTKGILQNITGSDGLPEMASFTQVHNLRKELNDIIMNDTVSDFVVKKDIIAGIKGQLDALLGEEQLENALRAANVGNEASGVLLNAAARLGPAREFYKSGMKQFEQINSVANLNALKKEVSGDGISVNAAGTMMKMIKSNNPQLLENVEALVKKRLGENQWEPLRQRISAQWVKDNLGKSLDEFESTGDVAKFNGSAFRRQLDNLGTTAPQLFKEGELNKIKQLAKEIEATTLSKVDDETIESVLSLTQPLDDVPFGAEAMAVPVGVTLEPAGICLLRNLRDLQAEKFRFERDAILKKLRAGGDTVTAEEAANLISTGATSNQTVKLLMKNFEDSVAAKELVQANYMQNIIGDFGETFLTDPKKLNEFGLRLQKEYKSDKLSSIFGAEQAKRMNDFGRVLAFNSQSVPGGELVASSISMAPWKNLDKLLRLTLIGRMTSSNLFYKNFDDQYKALKGASGPERAKGVGRILGEILSAAAKQTTAQSTAAGVTDVKKQGEALLGNALKQATPPAQPKQTRTSVPDVQPGSLPEQQMIPGQQPSLRERAAQNPAVAATLLGGLGSAGLL